MNIFLVIRIPARVSSESMILVYYFSLIKVMVSHDLPRSTVTKQIAFDQRDLHSTPVFERAMDRRC